MQRFRLLVIPSLLGILIFLAVDYFDQATENPIPAAPETTIAYNGYSEGINSVQFDEQGRVRYTMKADRQVSYVDAETTLVNPKIELIQGNDARWNIVARSGKISGSQEDLVDVEEIVFSGEVEVYQLDSAGNETVLTTEIMTLEPVLDLLTTDAAVTMKTDSLEQSAIGMRIELNSEEYIFHQNIRGRYEAPQN